MAQLGLALVGGAAFGPYGFLAGSLLGAWLFGEDQKGPRLNDMSVTISSQGAPIGLGYGTIPMAGNVIWKTDLVEHKKKRSAKGGPQITEYYYTCSLAVAFANREAQHLLKLYLDNKLLYDTTASGVYAPAGEDAITNEYGIKFRFYSGSETQEPDPLIESIEGAGNVPAFRGVCYAVFEDLNVTLFGNRVPSFQSVIAFGSAPSYPYVSDAMNATGTGHIFDHARGKMFSAWGNWMHVFDNGTNENTSSNGSGFSGHTGAISIDPEGRPYVHANGSNYMPMYQLDPDTLEVVGVMGTASSSGGWDKIRCQAAGIPALISGENCMVFACNQTGDITVYSRDKNHTIYPLRRRPYGMATKTDYSSAWGGDPVLPFYPDLYGIQGIALDQDGVIWGGGGYSLHSTGYLFKIQITLIDNPSPSSFEGTDKIANFTIERIDMSDAVAAMGGCVENILYDSSDHSLILVSVYSKRIGKWDIDSRTFMVFNDDLTFSSQGNMEIQNGYFMIVCTGANVMKVNATSLEVEETYAISSFSGFVYYGHVAGWDERTNSLYIINNESGVYHTKRLYLDRITNGTEALSDVVEDICIRSGMVAGDVDVTDLSAINVRGLNYARTGPSSQLVQSLTQGYLFIGVESDWKIKFKQLGTASVFAITENELGVSEEAKRDATRLKLSLGSEEEVPYHVGVSYIDENHDYELNEQHAARSIDSTNSRERFQVNLEIVLSGDEARRLAEKWLYLGWNRKKELSTTTFPRHLRIDPGDVGTITDDDAIYSAFVLNSTLGANGLLQVAALIDDVDVFTSTASGYDGEFDAQSMVAPGFTELFLLDIPYLRDADYNIGSGIALYFACGARSASWHGALILRSSDSYSFDKIGTALNSVTWGRATTILGDASNDWASYDPFRSVTVYLNSGTLASCTKTELLNGANAAALKSGDGWEIFQFKTVVDNGDGTYTLSGLIRGRRGTNRFVGDHKKGSLFVYLDSEDIELYYAPNEDYEQKRIYRPLTIGSDIVHPATNHTSSARSYMPYSPTYLKGTRDVSENLTVTWKRRTRVGGLWSDGFGSVPLGEDAETYEVDILLAGVVVRTIDATAETVEYTAAQQTTDGITPGDLIDVEIYQTNALVGRGFKAEAML